MLSRHKVEKRMRVEAGSAGDETGLAHRVFKQIQKFIEVNL